MKRWAGVLLVGAVLGGLGDSLGRGLYDKVMNRRKPEPDDSEVMVTRCPMCKGSSMVEVKPHEEVE